MLLLHGLCITFLTTFVYSFSIRNTFLTLYRNKKNINNPILKNIDEILENNPESKVIVSTPGGLFGYYFMGVSSFIKEHYDLSDYVFTGASAGAWNSLFLSLNKENTILVDELLKTDIKNIKSILKLEQQLKKTILDTYQDSNFDLEKLYLGVSVLEGSKFKLCIYNDFISLEDALDCCIASSHIPFVTGGPFNIYRNKLSFDGGFYNYPYLNVTTPSLIIAPDIWKKKNNTEEESKVTVINCSLDTIINLSKINANVTDLYYAGYNDSLKNKPYLDNIFDPIIKDDCYDIEILKKEN
mgnify:CR=1 FL=1|tara:strand:- start:69631 stop:70524 length:894 start_codon:yes stop_codon:yes gene_type:complete